MKCVGIIQEKCEEADNKDNCVTTAAVHTLLDEDVVVAIDLPQRPFGNAYYEQQTIRLVMSTMTQQDLVSRKTFLSKVLNCKTYNYSTRTCSACNPGYNLDSDICCKDGYQAITIASEGVKYCHKITELQNDCLSYDPANKVCLSCVSGKNLSYGKCCAADTYLSRFSDEVGAACNVSVPNCYNYSDVSESCLICKENYRLSNGKCVESTEYYSKK